MYTFAGRNAFRVFWPFSRKFMPLYISKQQNAKVFLHKIIRNFENAKIFSRKEKWQNWKSYFFAQSWKFFPRNFFYEQRNAKVYSINFAFFLYAKVSALKVLYSGIMIENQKNWCKKTVFHSLRFQLTESIVNEKHSLGTKAIVRFTSYPLWRDSTTKSMKIRFKKTNTIKVDEQSF